MFLKPLVRIVSGAVILAVLIGSDVAPGASITLQQGVDGYEGCADAHLVHSAYGDGEALNHSVSPELVLTSRYWESP